MISTISMISMILYVFSWFPFVGAYLRSFSGHFLRWPPPQLHQDRRRHLQKSQAAPWNAVRMPTARFLLFNIIIIQHFYRHHYLMVITPPGGEWEYLMQLPSRLHRQPQSALPAENQVVWCQCNCLRLKLVFENKCFKRLKVKLVQNYNFVTIGR